MLQPSEVIAIEAMRLAPSTAPTKGKLRYVEQGHTPKASAHKFQLPDMTEFGDERIVSLHSSRPVPALKDLLANSNSVKLNTHGFTAVHRPTPLHQPPHDHRSFKDPEALKKDVIPDTEEMLKQLTGCKTVVTEALLLRSALWSPTDALASHGDAASEESELETGFPQFIGFNPMSGGGSPASKIHLDYSPDGARTHIRNFHPTTTEAAAEIILQEDTLLEAGKDLRDNYKDSGGTRWALFSIWRPLKTVKRDPLAVADYSTVKAEDYVPVGVVTPSLGRPGSNETHCAEGLLARYSPQQKWYWIDNQKPEEALILRFFDSDEEKIHHAAGGVLHSSVELPGTDEEEPRESLEIRCLCVW